VLPAQRRVRRREDFAAAVRDGRRVAAPGLVIHVCADPLSGPARVGFIVGRTLGSAVHRNRLRRQLRHLVAPQLDRFPAGTIMVIRATPAAAGRTGRELETTLGALCERAVGVLA
jgi:ribonuclease P protein component